MFSQDEMFVFFGALFCVFFNGNQVVRHAWLTRPYRCHPTIRFPWYFGVMASAILLIYVLHEWSSYDVRGSIPYSTFYFIIGAAWLSLSHYLLDYLGLCIYDDILERGNLAASFACGGAFLGLTACFAGGNVGDGPGWWVVIYSAILSTSGISFAWIVLDMFTQMADSISIERDVTAGLRAGGFWIGAGLILGRAVAGNWVSFTATNRDFFFFSWPILALLSIAIFIELATRADGYFAKAPFFLKGILPAIAYIVFGIVSLISFGKP